MTAALDVAVLPSYREAQGLTILEAMALSRPVVASNVGGIPEMIEDGVTGILVPPHDADALTAASTDGGITWSAPAPLNPAAAAAQQPYVFDSDTAIAYDPAGYFFATWISNDSTLASGAKGYDQDVVMALAGHSCGNGVLDPGEECDDGDRGSLDCCGRACKFDAPGTACAADADPCTLERCDGAGTCDHVNAPLGTPCAADADLCTFDRCDPLGAAPAHCAGVFGDAVHLAARRLDDDCRHGRDGSDGNFRQLIHGIVGQVRVHIRLPVIAEARRVARFNQLLHFYIGHRLRHVHHRAQVQERLDRARGRPGGWNMWSRQQGLLEPRQAR